MRPAIHTCLIAGFPLAIAASAASKPAPAPIGQAPLDTNAVHELYMEGDFERAIAALDLAIGGKQLRSHEDSVFAFKHLGVMYAASEDTREKGKYYMLQLLHAEPTAKILDMYASDMIYMIFRNLKEEFEESRVKLHRANAHLLANRQAAPGDSARAGRPSDSSFSRRSVHAAPAAPSAHPPAASATRKPARRLWYLAGAAAAAVGVGVVAYLADGDSPPKKVVYEVE